MGFLPIRWVVVASRADGEILERYFSRHDWKVRRAAGRFRMDVQVASVEIIALCSECGEEVERCTCGVPLLTTPAFQAVH